ncbi:hypothetical protein [Streptomyces sp. DB-54]
MTDAQDTPTTPETPPPDAVHAESPELAPGNDESALPEWARGELTRARDEAARRRVQLRELKNQLAGMADPEEAQAAIQLAHDRLAETEQQLTRERLGRKYGLPDALIPRIEGEDEEAMERDAKALADLAPTAAGRPPRPDPLQGGGDPAPLSPADRFAQIIQTRLR